MQELESIIQQATLGDTQAFEMIVQRFQDMAVGYAYSVLGDFHLAEDAAQEAFVQVHRSLAQLREPKAFPSWFRTVVYKQCDRMTRRQQVRDVSLETTLDIKANQPSPAELVESSELRQAVQDALLLLPEAQQQVIVLFYIAEYSQKEISSFLDVPVTTVKKRLYDAKKRLKERMTHMAQEYFHGRKSSNLSVDFEDIAFRIGEVDGAVAPRLVHRRVNDGHAPGNKLVIALINFGWRHAKSKLHTGYLWPDTTPVVIARPLAQTKQHRTSPQGQACLGFGVNRKGK